MPIVFGEEVSSVEQALSAFGNHGDAVRGTYRARYVWDASLQNPYAGATLERPPSMIDNPASAIFPWEQIFVAAANCTGSDYPMLAQHLGVDVERVELIVEGVFDPRGEFDGLGGFHAPPDSRPCYLSLHLRAELVSSAPRESLERIHARVMATNMVLGALRGIPRTSELVVRPGAAVGLPSHTTSPHGRSA